MSYLALSEFQLFNKEIRYANAIHDTSDRYHDYIIEFLLLTFICIVQIRNASLSL